MISLLCRWIPALRFLWIGIGYLLLLVAGVIWFICFPLTAYTLYTARQFPLDYFGVHVYLGFPLTFFLPEDLWPALIPACLAFTLYGLFLFFFETRKLRKLRHGLR